MQLDPSKWAPNKLLLEVGECLFGICWPTVGQQHDLTWVGFQAPQLQEPRVQTRLSTENCLDAIDT